MSESIGVSVGIGGGFVPPVLDDLRGYEGFDPDWLWGRLDAAYEERVLAVQAFEDEVLSELYAESRDGVAVKRVLL